MRNILAALVAAMFCLPAQAQWTKLAEIHVSTKPASSRGDIFWNSTNTIARPVPLVRDQWNVIDVTRFGIPSDAKAVFVSGTLLISHVNGGTMTVDSIGHVVRPHWESANLMVAFRAFGDVTPIVNSESCITCQWYHGQAVEVDTGQRSTWSTWVPVTGGRIEMRFSCKDGVSQVDALSACGINLNVQAWGR